MTTPGRSLTVLIVDDTPANIAVLKSALESEYEIKVATSAAKAIKIAKTMTVDLILMDVMMPEMNGFEACRNLKADPMTSSIPVIFITARTDLEDESEGFASGGVDYITKPIRAPLVRARVKTHLALHDQNRALEEKVRERTAELYQTRLEILDRLGRAAEFKDNETGMHVKRIAHYCRIIANGLGMPENEAELLFNVAPMHDIGKIGIPDNILLKPGRLDPEERVVMQTHCEIGRKIIGNHDSDLLKASSMVARWHHEKWDGTGYPEKLKGEEIPLFCRILSIADVFDALTSERPYKKVWTVEDAVEEIKTSSGTHFDPDLVESFLENLDKIVEVKNRYADMYHEMTHDQEKQNG